MDVLDRIKEQVESSIIIIYMRVRLSYLNVAFLPA